MIGCDQSSGRMPVQIWRFPAPPAEIPASNALREVGSRREGRSGWQHHDVQRGGRWLRVMPYDRGPRGIR